MVLRMNAARSPWAARAVSNTAAGVLSDVDEPTRRIRAKKNWARLPKEPYKSIEKRRSPVKSDEVRWPGMHKETCSLLAWMKRSQRNHAVPGNTELAGHDSGSGSKGRPARRHARKLKRGGRRHCAAVHVQCTDASGQAGVSGRIARMLKQQARRRAGLREES